MKSIVQTALVLVLCMTGCGAFAAFPSYRITYMAPLPGSEVESPRSMNDQGDVLVRSSTSGAGLGHLVFLRRADGTVVELLPPPGTHVYDNVGPIMNDAGQAVTTVASKRVEEGFQLRAAILSQNEPAKLMRMPRAGLTTQGVAINNRGEVVGSVVSSDDPFGAATTVTWDVEGKPKVPAGRRRTEPLAINDKGIVGGSVNPPGPHKDRAVLLRPDGEALTLGTLPGDENSRVTALNHLDAACGVSSRRSIGGDTTRPFFWSERTGMLPMIPDDAHADACVALNDAGEAITSQGLYWTLATGPKAITELIDPADPLRDAFVSWVRIPRTINRHGQVLMEILRLDVDPSNARNGTVVLTPVR